MEVVAARCVIRFSAVQMRVFLEVGVDREVPKHKKVNSEHKNQVEVEFKLDAFGGIFTVSFL